MSLILELRSADNLKGKGDKVLSVSIRGVAQFSRIYECSTSHVTFDEVFRWNLPQALEAYEQLEINAYNYNKYLSNRLIGSFGMLLQQLVECHRLDVSDCLLGENNLTTQAIINFSLTYNPPDPRLTHLIDNVSQNNNNNKDKISNNKNNNNNNNNKLFRSRGASVSASALLSSTAPDAPLLEQQRSQIGKDNRIKSLRTIGRMMKLVTKSPRGKKQKSNNNNNNELVQSSMQQQQQRDVDTESCDSDAMGYSDGEVDDKVVTKENRLPPSNDTNTHYDSNKVEDFQISVTIIEARQLSGINLSPVTIVQVGDVKKRTSVKESTNCPYYNEYFVFDFHMIPALLFDKIITITVMHSKNLLSAGVKIGSFKLDVRTVYKAADHQFYHKWAILNDFSDPSAGPKGFVKCDIAVLGKGDKVKVPHNKGDHNEDSIEANLLVPDGCPIERQRSRLVVTIYRAEGLPRMTSGLVASFRKALTGENVDLVDAYVQVTFTGNTARTTVKRNRYNPSWDEEILFHELFPPFCSRIKIQIRDDSINNDVIATQFIDLDSIANEGENGFLPTFGPTWINMYGSTRSYSLLEEYAFLNEGFLPGIAYRGRLLLAVRTEILEGKGFEGVGVCGEGESVEGRKVQSGVVVRAAAPLAEFQLLGCVYECNMIDRSLADKTVQIELSIGNYGNELDDKQNNIFFPDSSILETTSLQAENPKKMNLKSRTASDVERWMGVDKLTDTSPILANRFFSDKDGGGGDGVKKKKEMLGGDDGGDDDGKKMGLGDRVDGEKGESDGGVGSKRKEDKQEKGGGGVTNKSMTNDAGKLAGGSLINNSNKNNNNMSHQGRFFNAVMSHSNEKKKINIDNDYKNKVDDDNDDGGGGGGGKGVSGGSGPVRQVSITDPVTPVGSENRCYYSLPYDDKKPLLWATGHFEDTRFRLFHANMLDKMVEKMKNGIDEVNEILKNGRKNPEKKTRQLLESFGNLCSRYLAISQTKSYSSGIRTKLDKECLKRCRSEIEQIASSIRISRPSLTSENVQEKLKLGQEVLGKLLRIRSNLQHSLPDVFVWLVQNRKRIAYGRLNSKDLIYSHLDEEKGVMCGKMTSLMLKIPDKKGVNSWNVQARLQMHLWLGLAKQRKAALLGLPSGFNTVVACSGGGGSSGHGSGGCSIPRGVTKPFPSPSSMPTHVSYHEWHLYQLRAHMYQARGLIGLDDSGLSDPFARVVFGKHCSVTRVIDESLNPSWDEMLIFKDVKIYAHTDDVKASPPEIIVEVFDRDRVGKSEFLGRCVVKPVVKGCLERYEEPNFPPKLRWWELLRGEESAGQLLAAFELLQLSPKGQSGCDDLPPYQLPPTSPSDPLPSSKQPPSLHMPVPIGIRPVLSRYRIEALLWGLRDLGKIQFLPVEKPRIDIECAGKVLSSSIIRSYRRNQNFLTPIKFLDMDLPENPIYCPPISIRCFDCRNFGRFVLVGNHVIDSISKFIFDPTSFRSSDVTVYNGGGGDGDGGDGGDGGGGDGGGGGGGGGGSSDGGIGFLKTTTLNANPITCSKNINKNTTSSKQNDVIIVLEDEKRPLVTKCHSYVTIDAGNASTDYEAKKKPPLKEDPKSTSGKTKRSLQGGEEEEAEIEGLDWWSKYHASKKAANQQPEKTTPPNKTHQSNSLNLTGRLSPNPPGGANKKAETEVAKKGHVATTLTSAATSLVSKLSPKSERKKEVKMNNVAKLVIYEGTLENEFNEFREWLYTFDLSRGKRSNDLEDDDLRVVGKFKGALVIYKLPLPDDIGEGLIEIGESLKIYRSFSDKQQNNNNQAKSGVVNNAFETNNTNNINNTNINTNNTTNMIPAESLFQGLPSNEPVHILIRVYVVKATDLHPADLNGKADPYVVMKLGASCINDKENYVSKQLNPVFGKCFEMEATFPQDSLLKIQVYDWDLIGSDDIIGETVIDLENREGYNVWRDPMQPTQILAKLCKEHKLDGPYYQPGKVRIGDRIFAVPIPADAWWDVPKNIVEERMALATLHSWKEMQPYGCRLVPEHVENRPLYHPERPGMEQGRLEMWVDMFPIDQPAPGPPVDISPRKPKSYELRVIIWNTDDVVLEDDAFFSGEKMSDIYVKGWIKGNEDMQSTDVHYRSLTGEGNFNWRFVYPFDYLAAEEKVVISKKDSLFSWDETETKIPPRLNLQVWDADHFSTDDFLGALTLDLTQFPRGAKSSKLCTLDMLNGRAPQMNLFKHKRVKGWWPFYVKVTGEEMELTGKVEAELHLFTAEEAEKHPAGHGRNEPEPLEKPKYFRAVGSKRQNGFFWKGGRPDTSFIWFLNPIKSIRHILWSNYKYLLLKLLLILLLILMLALFVYSLPGYTVKKMLGA